MEAKSARRRRLVYASTIITLCLLLCLAGNPAVQAQKRPPIFKYKTNTSVDPSEVARLETEASGNDQNKAKLARNKLIAIGVEQIDLSFNDYRKKSRERTDLLQFLFDFLEIGASSAISIVKGERPKALIAEGLSLFQGSRSAFNKDFRFLERQILFNKMVAKRSEHLTAIYQKLNQDTLEYPWEQARSELQGYFFAGTLDEAISELSVDTGAEAQRSQAELETAKREAGIVGAVTPLQLKASEAGATTLDTISGSFNTATTQLTKAQADLADANARLTAATAANDQTALAKATTDKAAAEGAQKNATDAQSAALAKLKAIYDAAETDATLAPLLPKLSTWRGIQAAQKARIENSLKNIAENKATFEDYLRVLLQLNRATSDLIPLDPRPSEEFQKILTGNK